MSEVNVLVVEDNPVNVEVLLEMLAELGCKSSVAGNGRDALGKFRRQRFRAVLMDCQMPIMDGFEATRGVREIERTDALERTPIIAVTANTRDSDREKCMLAGMDDFVKKPFTFRQIDDVIQRWVHGFDTAAVPPDIDFSAFEALRQTNPKVFPQLVNAYCDSLLTQTGRLTNAMATADHQVVTRISRSLHRSSTTLGVREVVRLSEEIRAAIQLDNLTKASKLVDTLATKSNVVVGLLKAHLGLLQQNSEG